MRVKREKRQEFFDCLEELANEVPEDNWEEAAQTLCSDEVCSLTGDVVTKTLQQVFPEGKKRWPEWMEEAGDWRMRLLDKRRDLREQEGEEFETVQMLLKEVSSLLKEAREKVNEQRTAELEAEMSEAWRNRQFALLHALRVEYARNGRGPKKRYYFSPRTIWDRWRNLLLKDGWGARSWTGKRTTTIT